MIAAGVGSGAGVLASVDFTAECVISDLEAFQVIGLITVRREGAPLTPPPARNGGAGQWGEPTPFKTASLKQRFPDGE